MSLQSTVPLFLVSIFLGNERMQGPDNGLAPNSYFSTSTRNCLPKTTLVEPKFTGLILSIREVWLVVEYSFIFDTTRTSRTTMAASQLNQRRTLGTAPSSNHSAPDDSRVTNSTSNRRQRPASRRTNATNPYNQSHQTLPATIFVTVLIIGISLWLLIPLILAKHTTIFHGLRVTTPSASNQDQNVDNNQPGSNP